MLSLIIETCTEQALVAILENNKLLFESFLPVGYQSSKYLLPEIDRGLKKTNIQIKNFHFIAVGVGPGSYTGIRMGVMTAKTFAFAANIPLIDLCTLQNFIPSEDGSFAVLIDAKLSGVYALRGDKKGTNIVYNEEPRLLELNQLESVLKKTEIRVCPEMTRINPLIEAMYPHFISNWEITKPNALHMHKMAVDRFERKKFSIDGNVNIMYLRKTQAEIELEAKKNRGIVNS